MTSTESLKIILNQEGITNVMRSNLCCFYNKTLTEELIDTITKQLVEALNDFVDVNLDVIDVT